jgi:hypothetical protein
LNKINTNFIYPNENSSTSEECTISSGNSSKLSADVADDMNISNYVQNNSDTYAMENHVPNTIGSDPTPITILVANTIGACRSRKLLKALLDSGSAKH